MRSSAAPKKRLPILIDLPQSAFSLVHPRLFFPIVVCAMIPADAVDSILFSALEPDPICADASVHRRTPDGRSSMVGEQSQQGHRERRDLAAGHRNRAA